MVPPGGARRRTAPRRTMLAAQDGRDPGSRPYDRPSRRFAQAIALVAGVTMAASGTLLVLSATGLTHVGALHGGTLLAGTGRAGRIPSTESGHAGAEVAAAGAAAAVAAGLPARTPSPPGAVRPAPGAAAGAGSSSTTSVPTPPTASPGAAAAPGTPGTPGATPTTAASTAGGARAPVQAPSGPGTVQSITLAAPGETSADRAVFIYRPAVPDSVNLPVLYFLHGVPGGPDDVFAAGLATFLDDAFAHGAAPFVVVSPDGNGANHDDTEWADAADGSDNVESFLVDVVIPQVEGANRRDGAHRAIAGDSMGGYGAMNIAMRHPGLFLQVATIAGYFHVDDPSGMFGGQPALIDANSPDLHPAAATNLHILLLDGADESDPVIRGESQRMSKLLDQAGIPNDLELPPGDDSWDFAAGQFKTVTAFLEAGFATA